MYVLDIIFCLASTERKIEKTLYLSEEENKILEEKCKKLNLSKSDYIRKLIKEYTPIKADMSTS